MQQLLHSYTNYEIWANEQLLQVSLDLTPEEQNRPVISSFSSVYKTFLHMWDASSIWWQRLQKQEQLIIPSQHFQPTMKDIANGLLQLNRQWENFVGNATDEVLLAALPYKNLKGERFEQPVFEILMHLLNHGTYHRGQVVTLLRQVGVNKIPQTDYILFSRTNKQ